MEFLRLEADVFVADIQRVLLGSNEEKEMALLFTQRSRRTGLLIFCF